MATTAIKVDNELLITKVQGARPVSCSDKQRTKPMLLYTGLLSYAIIM